MTKEHSAENPHPVDIHVGLKIRQARASRGLSQEQLGEAIKLTFQQIQKYERGFNRVSASKLYEIAKTLNLPVGHFFEGLEQGTGTPPPVVSRAGMELVRYFMKIADRTTRDRVLGLVRTLSKQKEEEADSAKAA